MKKVIAVLLLFNIITNIYSQNEVGVSENDLSVSLSGAAQYNLPILTPPGLNQVEPHVSLAYDSQSGYGIAGNSWNISGVSTITRIPATMWHDGVIDEVNFNNLDRYALDGSRLILMSGVYGADGAVYETENFSNLRVTSIGAHPDSSIYGPSFFKVEYPDGSIAYYGLTTNNHNSQSVAKYSISYFENPQGIRVNYFYELENNCLRIKEIKYGEQYSFAGINQIIFNYSPSQDEKSYINGKLFVKNKTLRSINVIGNGQGYRNYILEHQINSNGTERLTSITDKSGDNSKSLNPIIFNYPDTVDSMGPSPITTVLSYTTGAMNYSNQRSVSGDFNGDGQTDFLLYREDRQFYSIHQGLSLTSTTGVGYKHEVGTFEDLFTVDYLSNIQGGYKINSNQGWCVVKTNSTTNETAFTVYSPSNSTGVNTEYTRNVTFQKACPSSGGFYASRIYRTYLSGDFNGDGLTDVIAINRGISGIDQELCSSAHIPYSSSSGVWSQTGKAYFINLDKRITTNFITEAGQMPDIGYMANETGQPLMRILTGDVNGDGKTDIVVLKYQTINVYTLDANNNLINIGTTAAPELFHNSLGVYDHTIISSTSLIPGDYNGDGKMDFIIKNRRYTSVGSTFIIDIVSCPFSGTSDQPQQPTYYFGNDIDRDGKTDVVAVISRGSSITVIWSRNRNGCFENIVQDIPFVQLNCPIAVNYSTFQNQFSIGLLLGGNQLRYLLSYKDFSQDKLLTSIVDQNGVQNTITYKRFMPECLSGCNSTYLSSDEPIKYPNKSIVSMPNYFLVSKLEKQSTSAYKKQLFSYYGAVSNDEGLGFMGFQMNLRTNWHNDTNPIISTISKQDISLRGAEKETYLILNLVDLSGNLVYTNFITKSVKTYNSYDNTNFEPSILPNKVFKLKNTISENINQLEGTSSLTTSIYDNYNNIISSTTNLKAGSTIQKTTLSECTFDNNSTSSTDFYIGRLTTKKETATVNSTTMISQQNFDYYSGAQRGLLKQCVKFVNDDNTQTITEDNIYDDYGNLTKKTLSATGVASPRIMNLEYDPTTHRFLTKKIDIEGLTRIFTYNLSTGNILTEKSPYLLTTTYEYDVWGKRKKIIDYLGKTTMFDYTLNNGNTTEAVHGIDSSVLSKSETFDDLGRKIKTGYKNINGNWVFTSYTYDIYDRIIKVSKPYFGTNLTSDGDATVYDEYGRIIKKESSTGKTINIAYSGLTSTTTEGLKVKTILKNSIGDIVSMSDAYAGVVNYTYFPDGNLKSTSYDGNVTSIMQNGWGKRTQLNDPSAAGTYRYEYNLFGETTKEITALGTTTYTLNDYGKVIEKTIIGTGCPTNSKNTYGYDSTTKLLTSMRYDDFSSGTVTNYLYEYDSFKRLWKTTETGNQAIFQRSTSFDSYGRPLKEFYSAKDVLSGLQSTKYVRMQYDNGFLKDIKDDLTSNSLWFCNTVNERNQVLTGSYGFLNVGVLGEINNSYDDAGMPTSITFRTVNGPNASSVPFLSLSSGFDMSNEVLTNKGNSMFSNWDESSLSYDPLDRLIGGFKDLTGQVVSQNYDGKGRIQDNSLGLYKYNIHGKPYQNSEIKITDPGGTSYYATRSPQQISYTTFGNPISISEHNKEKIDFEYNAFNDRAVMYYGSTDSDKNIRPNRKFYSWDRAMEIKRNLSTGETEFITYINGNAYSSDIVLKNNGNGINESYYYLQRDYQGSILSISNSQGVIVEKRLFDAWGQLVKLQDNNNVDLAKFNIIDNGYTGHEHLLGVGLINMNGRLYDPKLRRFLSPDNNVQDLFNTQNYNRYSYVLNNPYKYTDPSGESWLDLIGFVISFYVHAGAASGGETNPTKWEPEAWMSGFSGATSSFVSFHTTNMTNDYLDRYDDKPTIIAPASGDVNPAPSMINNFEGGYDSTVEDHSIYYDFITVSGIGGTAANVLRSDIGEIDFFTGTSSTMSSYEREMASSLSQIQTLKNVGKVLGKSLYWAGYYEGADKFINGEFLAGAIDMGSNYTGELISASPKFGWGYGLAWTLTWEMMDKKISQTEWYNRYLFGTDSSIYFIRGIQNGWYFKAN